MNLLNTKINIEYTALNKPETTLEQKPAGNVTGTVLEKKFACLTIITGELLTPFL